MKAKEEPVRPTQMSAWWIKDLRRALGTEVKVKPIV